MWGMYLDARFLTMVAVFSIMIVSKNETVVVLFCGEVDFAYLVRFVGREVTASSARCSQKSRVGALRLMVELRCLGATCRCADLPMFTNRLNVRVKGSTPSRPNSQLIDCSLPCQLPAELSEVPPVEVVKAEVKFLLLRTAPQTYLVPS